jgi:uncharacterized protein (TIGR03437 family)
MKTFTILALLLVPVALFAQKDRIAGSIDSSRMVAVPGNVPTYAQPQFDQGPLDPATKLNYLTLTLKTSAAQQADLDQLLRDLQDPFSRNFRKWLTPEQYADRFGASPEDLNKISFWLESQGLEIITKARGRRWIAFNATAGQIQSAFHTEIRHYQIDGELHFANATAPQIPEALREMVLMVDGLNDFHPRHMTLRKIPMPTDMAAEHPATTASSGAHQLAPGDVWVIYDTLPLLTKGITGAGQKIAIIDRSNVLLSDISLFRSTFGLPATNIQTVLVPGTTDPGITSDNAETNLDLDWAGSIAPNAQLLYVFAPSVWTAVGYAVDQALAPVITFSYYSCEQGQSGSVAGSVQALAQQANAQGITWLACSGDAGAEGCDSNNYTSVAGTHGVSISIYTGVPEITGVGGTTFNEGSGRYWGAYNGNPNSPTALSYIPETSWQGSGGGYSTIYPKPDWQIGVPDTATGPWRGAPDVAFSSDPNHDGYLIYDNGKQEPIGGTSIATPVFAGMVALLNQYLGTNGLGNINPNLYRLAQNNPNVFHDVTTGNNFHYCQSGTPNCGAGSHPSVGYTAEPGWDAVTGLGSVDAANLLAYWDTGIVGTATTVTANPSSFTLSGQTTLTVTVKAAGSSITPTGTVAFTFGSTSLGTATLSGSGSTATATLTLYGSQLASGSDAINVTYGGDKNVNGSTAAVTVTVTVPTATSAVIPSIAPNPVYEGTPDANGYAWFYTVQLSEVAGSSTTLTGFSIDGTDYSSSIASFFGTSSMPANGTLSASLEAKGLAVPLTRVFVFSGRDSNGRTWTQQATAQFLGTQISAAMALIGAPNIVLQDPTQSSDCQYSQNLGVQELNGHSVTLTRFLADGTDYSSQIAYFFGSATLPAFGSLQSGICWDLTGDTLPENLGYEIDGIDDQGNAVSATTSTYFATAAANPGTLSTSADPNGDVIAMALADSTKSTTATVAVKVKNGQAWSITTFPSNRTASWLVVYPLSGIGPATVNLAASGTGLDNGLHQATLVVQSTDALPEYITVSVNLVVGTPLIQSVANGASLTNTGLSPGLIFTLFGTGLGPDVGQTLQLDTDGNVVSNLSGIQVMVNGTAAPLLYVGQSQINAVAPYEIAGSGNATIQVLNNGVQSATTSSNVVAAAPAIFSLGNGQGAILNQDGTVNGPSNPAARGSVVSIYGTGEGQTNPPGVDGAIANEPLAGLPRPAAPFSLTIGGQTAQYTYAGTAPQSFAGFFQVNAVIPQSVASGNAPVILKVGSATSQPLNVVVQ